MRLSIQDMKNWISREGRRCGLCYFHLKPDTPLLKDPPVSRRARVLAGWPPPVWVDGLPDDVVPTGDISNLEIKTKFIAIHKSANRGCASCAVILQCLEAQALDQGFTLDQDCMDDEFGLTWRLGQRKLSESSLSISLTTKAGGDTYRTGIFPMIVGYDTRYRDHPAARKLPESIVQGYTGSSVSLQNLKEWLKNCDTSHKLCLPKPSAMPHRLLQVSQAPRDNISIRLVQDVEETAPYVCLSHRWNESTLNCRTTRDTVSQHLRSVPWEILPKTYQEAATVVLHLGLKYIWIDSLCIIQDDEDDWKVQAAQMCNIYQGAYVTIAATGTNHGSGGLFWTLPKVPIGNYGPTKKGLVILQAPSHRLEPHTGDSVFDFPLLNRGWVYQERLLSSRIVHFTRYELMFECVGSPASCECGAYGIGTLKLDHQESLETSKIADISRYWRDAMSQYSQLHLTYHSDRLSALAGIARQYGTTHKNTLGRYVAGMWENTLVNDLLWLVANGYQSNRPEVCYAPTWSWASVTGGTSTLALTSTTQTLEIVGLELKLAGQDEFGALSTATLTVRGQLTPGSWRWVSRPGGWEGIHFYAYASGEETTHHLKLDYNFSVTGNSRHVAPGSTIFCLKTGFVAAGSHVFMVLRMVNEEQRVFERIGLLQGVSREEAEAWMSGEPEQEIIHLV